MLSKCLNPRCSAKFLSLKQGLLFRIDFSEAKRKNAHSGTHVSSILSKTYPVEHFWLCGSCAASMTIELSEDGQVRAVPLQTPAKKAAAAAHSSMRQYLAKAS